LMLKAAYIGFAVLAADVLCAVFVPEARLWGLHFLNYYSLPVRIAFLVLAVLALGYGWLWKHRAGFEPRLPLRMSLSPIQGDVIAALCCGVVFLFFSSATALLGDGQLWLNEIQAGTSDYLRNRAPFTLFLLHTLYAWLNPLTGISAMRLFGLVSILAGMLAVLGWLTLARHLRMDRLTALLLGFTWGGVALFFGYIETYVIMIAVLTWMLVLAVISLRKDKPSLFVPVLGVLAVGFNLGAAAFLPAVAAYTWRMFSRRALRPKIVCMASLGAIILAASTYFALGWDKGTDVLLPLVPIGSAFGDAVLSAGHLADLANVLVLTAGAFGMLLLVYAFSKRANGFHWNDEKLILLLAVAFPLAALIMHNPQLGMARDWDIAAALLLAVPVISLLIWDSIRPLMDSPARIRGVLMAWLLMAILPWTGVQASERLSMQRFKDLLRLDPAKSESGWDYLSSYYFHRNQIEDWAECNFEAMKYSNNPRYHANAALYYCMKHDWEKARKQAELARAAVMADSVVSDWEEQVTDPEALIALGNSYLERAYVNDAQRTYDVAAVLQPESAWPPIALADMYLRLRDLDHARQAVDSLAMKGPSQMNEASRYFAAKIDQVGSEPQIVGWIGLSLIADSQKRFPEAERYAQKAFQLSKDDRVAALLDSLRTQAAQPN
jgi:hypothetical protein